MTDPIQALLDAGAIPSTSFPPTSRYAATPATALDPGGDASPVPYLRRRFCPSPDRFADLYQVTVIEGDRRDVLAARHVGDAELWWRLADANGAIDPREMTERPGTDFGSPWPRASPEPAMSEPTMYEPM